MSESEEKGAPENAQDLTIFVQNLLEQMVSMFTYEYIQIIYNHIIHIHISETLLSSKIRYL